MVLRMLIFNCRVLFFLIGSLGFFSLQGCQKQTSFLAQVQHKGEVLALVNGEPITVEEFESEQNLAPVPYNSSSATEIKNLKGQLFQQLLIRRLLLQEVKRRGLRVSSEEVKNEVKKEAGRLSFQELHAFLNSQSSDAAEWQQRIHEEILISRLLQETVKKNKPTTWEEEKAYYEKYQTVEFKEPEQLKIRQVLVKTKKQAERLRSMLKNGLDFSSLASKQSVAEDGIRGGDWGFCRREDISAEFVKPIFKLALGEVSLPIKSAYGYHLFFVEAKKKPGILIFSAARPLIQKKLSKEKQRQSIEQFLELLQNNSRVEMKRQF